jgi:tol-pal system protein YbgF
MILKNLLTLIIIALIFAVNCASASEEGYVAIIKKQSAQIKSLQSRLDHLEQTVATMKAKQLNSEPKPNLEKQITHSQEVNSVSTEDKKIPSKENKANEVQVEYDLALASLKDGNFREAEEKFANFIQTYKNHKLRENAVFWYAESFYRQGNFNQAAIHYLKSYKEYTKGSKASDSLLKLSLSLGKLKKLKEACAILDKLETEFPKRSADSLKRAAEARTNFNCKK